MGIWADYYNDYVPINPITDEILLRNTLLTSHDLVEEDSVIPLVTFSKNEDVMSAIDVTYKRLIARRVPEKTGMGLHELVDLNTYDFKVILDICTKEINDEAKVVSDLAEELENEVKNK